MANRSPDALIARAVRRWHELFDGYGHVYCSVSGGKDSTVAMETGAIAARERGHKLLVVFFDEEVISPLTGEYLARVRLRDDVAFSWFCVPVEERNSWSREHPIWWPWAPEDRANWVREMPAWAITDIPGYANDAPDARLGIDHLLHKLSKERLPVSTANVIGRRAEESPARKLIAKTGWITKPSKNGRRYSCHASVIMEWTTNEVWDTIRVKGWDWNRYYQRMYQAGSVRNQLRIGPLFGEEPSVNLHVHRKAMPTIWQRVPERIPGGNDLARYALSPMAGRGRMRKGYRVTREQIRAALADLPPGKRRAAEKSIRKTVQKALQLRIKLNAGDLLKIAIRGDTKGGRLGTSATTATTTRANKLGHWRVDKRLKGRDIHFIKQTQRNGGRRVKKRQPD